MITALAVGAAIFLLVTSGRAASTVTSLDRYLLPQVVEEQEGGVLRRLESLRPALPWVMTGSLVGVLLSQGDLFVSGPGRSMWGLALLGGLGGWFGFSARRSSLHDRRVRQLRFELPVVADALALQVVSGESVATAVSNVCRAMSGVAVEEFTVILERASSTIGMSEALLEGSRTSIHPDGRRLYEVLAHAHESGGRLGQSLRELAVDYRAALERDVTSEGGKRAVATYAPVLALMVPTTLLFLLYPTVLGLRALSGAP